jgi:hypothetical protein
MRYFGSHRFLRRGSRLPLGYRYAVLGEKLLGLILVQIHELSFNAELVALRRAILN